MEPGPRGKAFRTKTLRLLPQENTVFDNREFRELCERFGIPTDERGHDLGVRAGTPFERYCEAQGVDFKVRGDGASEPGAATPAPPPLLPVPPATPGGSRLRKWRCPCGVNVRVGAARFDATCNRCGGRSRLQG